MIIYKIEIKRVVETSHCCELIHNAPGKEIKLTEAINQKP